MGSSEATFSVDMSELSESIPEDDASDSSSDSDGPLRFEVILSTTFRRYVVFPDLPDIVGGTRWVLVKTEHDRDYKVEMVNDGGGFTLRSGWNILAATDNLEEGQTLMFQMESQDSFHMWINDPSRYTLPVGFSPERASYSDWRGSHTVVNPGTVLRAEVTEAIHEVWHACSIDSPIYVCRLLTTPSEGWCLIFNSEYSRLIPQSKSSVAMRFIGSKVVIPGAFKRYTDGCARISSNWTEYAHEHNLVFGEVFVCTIVHGPRLWEFIGCVAGREV